MDNGFPGMTREQSLAMDMDNTESKNSDLEKENRSLRTKNRLLLKEIKDAGVALEKLFGKSSCKVMPELCDSERIELNILRKENDRLTLRVKELEELPKLPKNRFKSGG